MSAWRRVAMEKLATLAKTIKQADTIGMLWVELSVKFGQAHREPVDESIIRGTYEFAWWCVGEAKNDDLATAAVCGFYEHLPRDPRAVELLPTHMTKDEFLGMREVFKYFLSPEEHAAFVSDFLKRREHFQRTLKPTRKKK
jgi:hypothetical protein